MLKHFLRSPDGDDGGDPPPAKPAASQKPAKAADVVESATEREAKLARELKAAQSKAATFEDLLGKQKGRVTELEGMLNAARMLPDPNQPKNEKRSLLDHLGDFWEGKFTT